MTIRKQFVLDTDWTRRKQKPAPVALALACPEGTGLVRSYGWRSLETPAGEVEAVGGYLKLTDKVAEETMQKSGQDGIFFDRLAQSGPRGEVEWKPRIRDEDDMDYLERALEGAQNRGLAYRRGAPLA